MWPCQPFRELTVGVQYLRMYGLVLFACAFSPSDRIRETCNDVGAPLQQMVCCTAHFVADFLRKKCDRGGDFEKPLARRL